MDDLARNPEFEEVFTVTEYYDGPRQGIANFNGLPHFYDCTYSSEPGDCWDTYYLTPVQESVLNDALEDWAIFRRWELAFHTGQATEETAPWQPKGSARSKELRKRLDEVLKTDLDNCFSRVGQFEPAGISNTPRGVLAPMCVRWSKLR